MLGVNAMHALNRFLCFRRRRKLIINMDAPNHQYSIFQLDLASDFGGQMFVARVYLARLQRASKGTGESTTGCGHHVVKRGRVRLNNLRVDAVVLRYRTMDAKAHRLWLGWQVG
jgi:hypothetical protein